ncbi:hypothetical protein HGRIS_003167 [Hohenbuehelia grisea]|uniref:Cytochrome P450 n=1 Tax=Hohenbuehelia grisea TaxID=104357 RepID=A0ABR3JPI2_9AGAR
MFAGSFLLVMLAYWLTRRQYKLPPGPKPRWLIGNDINQHKTWVHYAELAKTYGPIMHLSSYGTHFVVLSSEKVVRDLLDRRSSLYSDRPLNPMFEFLGWDWSLSFMPYSDKWRRHRRVFHESFRQEAMLQWNSLQLKKLRESLRLIDEDPSNFSRYYRMLTASVIMSAVYGYDVTGVDDTFVDIADKAMDTLASAFVLPGAVGVQFVKVLALMPSWFPGAALGQSAANAIHATTRMLEVPFTFVKNNRAEHGGGRSMAGDLLELHASRNGSVEEETIIKNVTATAYAGAADTAVSTMLYFTAAIVLHPHVAKRAQTEIDALLGGLRLPTFEDRPHLPYVEAIYREIMRWRPVVPLVTPHSVVMDDVYEGFHFPKGTTFIPNVWAMTRDENRYADHDTFKPERFLDDDGNLNGDDTIFVWGFGRRICPGRYFVSDTIWAFIAMSLAVFDFTLAKDEHGQDIPVDVNDESDTFIVHPNPFKCSIKPRSHNAESLLHEKPLV